MKVSVFGLGYVGCVTAACLADRGHDVTGVDIDDLKVATVDGGRSPILEPDLDDLVGRGVQSGRLRARREPDGLGDVVLVCVGTPSNDNGSLGLAHLRRVITQIGERLPRAPGHVVVAVRSTVLPGTVEGVVIPALEEASGLSCGRDFGVCMNPEFMRETTAVRDFATPPFTVVGAREGGVADLVASLYADVEAPVERTSIREAEMIKYACNAFHATKVCFANEIGNLSKQLGVDSHRVMGILCRDHKLNLSPYYLKPGFAFGGSCLPKDLRAILYMAKHLDVDTPMLSALLDSNRRQVDVAFTMVKKTGKTRIGVLGLSFKAGTDDLRESPVVTLVETLIGKGYDVRIHDADVSLARLHGANRRYIAEAIPHLSGLMADSIDEVLETSDVIVVAKASPDVVAALQRMAPDRVVLDLVRVCRDLETEPGRYEGICW